MEMKLMQTIKTEDLVLTIDKFYVNELMKR